MKRIVLWDEVFSALNSFYSIQNGDIYNQNVTAKEKCIRVISCQTAKQKTVTSHTTTPVVSAGTFDPLNHTYTFDTDTIKEKYKEFDLSLNEGKTYSSVSKSLAKWLFNEERQEKSTAVIYDDNELCYYVVYFKDRYKSTTNTVTIKSIFVPYILTDFNSFEFSTADKDKTEETVKEILDKWEKSEKKESDFDQLLKEYNKTNRFTRL